MSKQSPHQTARVFVAGHQRPDADTAVSAFVAAKLKGRLDPSRVYEPILPGEANQQTRWIFERAGEPLPAVRGDIRHTVGEGMSLDFISLRADAHLAAAVELMHQSSGSLIPVVEQDGKLAGVLSDRLPQSRYFYNFNAEDYLGQLLDLQDVVSAIGLVPLRKNQRLVPSKPGSFRLASVPVATALETWTPEDVVLCGAQAEAVEIAAEKKVCAVIFADCDFEEAKELAAPHPKLPAFYFSGSLMSLVSQLPMAIPVSIVMERNVERLASDQMLEDVREQVARTPHALPVVDEVGRLLGILTKVDMIEERKRLIILVDHFERSQSVRGIEQAEILEIIDHHRVGNIETMSPVRVDCRPVGSTASILAAQFAEAGLQPTRSEALLLLGALVSDTLLLTSPTTVPSDSALAKQLAKRARVNLREFGHEVLRQNDSLASAQPDALVERDLKEFQHGAIRFAAAQVETVDLQNLTEERTRELLESLREARRRLGVEFALLMVTDVFRGESHVLVSDDNAARAEVLLGGSSNGGGRRFAGMVSRKKQLLPMIFKNLDHISKKGAAR